jgi:hypothetical protein
MGDEFQQVVQKWQGQVEPCGVVICCGSNGKPPEDPYM